MIRLTPRQRLRHLWIRPLAGWVTCPLFTPIPGSLLWLLHQGQLWIVQVMLAPLLMGALLAALTLLLSHLEYRR